MRFRRIGSGRRQRGLSLVEAAVAMAVMGVAVTLLWQAVGVDRRREDQNRVHAQLQRAESAVLAFVAVHQRFPCPATGTDGVESCAGRPTTGHLPFRTLGMPEVRAARIRLTVDPAIAAPDGRFLALVNDRTMAPGGDPRAVPMALRDLLSSSYDGMLDVCETLAGGVEVGKSAYTFEAMPDESTDDSRSTQTLRGIAVSAAQVSEQLGCGAMVAVAGRGQFNAHLAAAAMSKAIQDHRVQSEVAYSLNHWNLSEGIWSFSNGMYSAMKNWAKLVQTASALDANIWANPGPFAALHAKAITDRTVELVGVAARASNLARYINNLRIAQDDRRAHHDLVAATLARYDRITHHALIGAASAWFLREQQQGHGAPANPGPAQDYGVNQAAQAIARASQAAAETLGHGDLLAPHTLLPAKSVRSPEPPEQRLDP